MEDMSDPKKAVQEFLKKEGYPLEMYVTREFKKAAFEVYQSMLYTDKETNKTREIDVVAYSLHKIYDVTIQFKVIIECKFDKNIWILFKGENKGFRDLPINNLYCSNYAGNRMLECLQGVEGFNEKDWFIIKSNLCYGVTETYKEGRKNESRATHKALMKIISVLQSEKDYEKNQKDNVFTICIPLIIVDGNLFESFLDNENEITSEKISEGQLLYKSNVYPNVFPLIEIVTKSQVPELAKKLKGDFEAILNNYHDALDSILKEFPSETNYYFGSG